MHPWEKWAGIAVVVVVFSISGEFLQEHPWGARAALMLAECRQGNLGSGFGVRLSLLQLHHKSLGSIRQQREALDDSLAANNLMPLRLKDRSFGD